jgi:serine protease AprX
VPTATPVPTATAGASLGALSSVVDQINARRLWDQGITGEGVHVAVIDTGVAPVPALLGADKVVAMVDLSFEAEVPEAVYLDTNGHGTHMAGIIAGNDPATGFRGVAPGAGIVSVKVGDNTGAVDVSQVIAGIDWVIEHKNDQGLNIRVLNLSYGTDSTQDYRVDPLSYAVERAWRAGIVVVVAAGNDGWFTRGGLANPAHDPYVIAVGAAQATSTGFTIPSWTSVGELVTKSATGASTSATYDDYALFFSDEYTGRMPDLVAPGASIESLRAPGSRIALEHPEGYVSDAILKGSGSSQAAAVTSGAAALLLQARPALTPDQVKALLTRTARPIAWALPVAQGAGVLDVAAAAALPVPSDATQSWTPSTGLGSLDAARGTQRVAINGQLISGEVTVTGAAWNPAMWNGARWTGGSWNGASWTGASWTGASWTGASWTGASWTGARWTGASWTGASWTGASWTGASWTGASWTGASWTGASWTGNSWQGAVWR